jgi:DNA-binding transcriptional MerR regulator
MDEMELLTIGTAARILNRSVFTLRQWERRGKLVARRDSSGRRLYNAEDVRQMAASMTGHRGAGTGAQVEAPDDTGKRHSR